ncbi:unnamed protein product, partial [Mesorhabditis belari]|uniref:Uncharacterized protein n=1 Tax=Mesorhabditis belari TaxID=2138241 RepID=A0AAF3JBG9_9BILA
MNTRNNCTQYRKFPFSVGFLRRIPSILSTLMCLMFVISLVHGACATDQADMGCGEHPLKGILSNLDSKHPNLSSDQVVRLLLAVQKRYPRLWRAYEAALDQYTNCRLMATSGSLG